jgi:hypothetical protein
VGLGLSTHAPLHLLCSHLPHPVVLQSQRLKHQRLPLLLLLLLVLLLLVWLLAAAAAVVVVHAAALCAKVAPLLLLLEVARGLIIWYLNCKQLPGHALLQPNHYAGYQREASLLSCILCLLCTRQHDVHRSMLSH